MTIKTNSIDVGNTSVKQEQFKKKLEELGLTKEQILLNDINNIAQELIQVEKVKKYIARQHEHHQRTTFQDEFRLLLKKHQVEYDERYVWD